MTWLIIIYMTGVIFFIEHRKDIPDWTLGEKITSAFFWFLLLPMQGMSMLIDLVIGE